MKKLYALVVLATLSLVAVFAAATADAVKAPEGQAYLLVGVTDEAQTPIAGAVVTFNGNTYETDQDGIAEVSGIDAALVSGKKVPLSIYKDGYKPYEGEADFTEELDVIMEAALEAEQATLTVKVIAGDDPVEGALVTFNEKEETTVENGEVKFTVPAPEVMGTMQKFTVYKDGYKFYEGEANFIETMEASAAVFLEVENATLTIKVMAGEDPVEGATVTFARVEYTTSENGEVKITDILGTEVIGTKQPFTVYKDAYKFYEGEADFSETLDAYAVAELEADEASLTVKVMADGVPVAEALVTFDGKEYVAAENGEVKIEGISAPAVFGKAVPVTVYKDGYEVYEGEAEFTETLDAYLIAELQPAMASLTVKVMAGEDPVEGALVTFARVEYTTSENGEVKVTDILATEVIGKKQPFTVYKDGYKFFEGEADFTEGFDAYAVANLEADEANLTVKVMADGEPVAAAMVTFGGKEYTTAENGEVKIEEILAPAVIGTTQPVTVYKDGYKFYEGEADFTETLEAYLIAELEAEEATLLVKVVDGEYEPVAEAVVTFDRGEYTTGENGEVKIAGLNGPTVIGKTFPVTVYKDGYKFYEGEADFTETLEASLVAVLEAEGATFTIKVMAGEEPVADAIVTFNGQEELTAENGEIKFTGISAPAVIGKTLPVTVYKDGYKFYEGEADFTEGFDAFLVAELEADEALLTVKVVDSEYEPLAGALVTVEGKEYTTGENGEVKIEGISAPAVIGKTLPITVYKDGYKFYEGEADFTETLEAYVIAMLEPEEASLTVKVVDEEYEPVAGAIVTFDGNEYTTAENGEVKIEGISALAVLGTEQPLTVTKGGYESYTGVADFTETLEAYVVVTLKKDQSGINSIYFDPNDETTKAYDLQGRRVLHPAKGQIYIVNGRKVIFGE